MHRKALRITVGTADVDVPMGVFAANQVALYDGTQFKGSTPMAVPGSTVVGDIVTWNSTTGAALADPGILAANLVQGPGSSVAGNIASFSSGTGKALQDSGVSATAHAARHIPGGADTAFPGTYVASDEPQWNGAAFVQKFRAMMRVTTDQNTFPSGALTAIPGLSASLPRAGNYYFSAALGVSMANTTNTVGFAIVDASITGAMYTLVHYSNATVVNVGVGAVSGTPAQAIVAHAVTTVLPVIYQGMVTVSGASTLQLALIPNAANIPTVKANSSGIVYEL